MIYWIISGQSLIPPGIETKCYSSGDCSGAVNEEFTQRFDSSQRNINQCCYNSFTSYNLRSNLQMLSFKLNDGECRRCDGKATYIYVQLQQ